MSDLGCGTETYGLCFTELEFKIYNFNYQDITIDRTKELFKLRFTQLFNWVFELSQAMNPIKHLFKFAFDYEVLHRVFPENRSWFVENEYFVLTSNMKYLSVCFSEANDCFKCSKNTEKHLLKFLYLSSEKKIEELVSLYFDIIVLTIKIKRKPTLHHATYCLMQKNPLTN